MTEQIKVDIYHDQDSPSHVHIHIVCTEEWLARLVANKLIPTTPFVGWEGHSE